ncbi:MAG: DNA gyrase inhibitor YacG [Chthoniobacteraceae bacterium]
MNKPNSTVPCATCGKDADFFAEPTGPFCSRRCKLVDLGKWLGEEHRISEPLRPDHFEDTELLDDGGELDRH